MPTTRGMSCSICCVRAHHTPSVIAGLGTASRPVRLAARLIVTELGQARVPLQSILFEKSFAKKMDPRVISASTRVFDALLPAGDATKGACHRPRGRQPPRMPGRPVVERGPGR